MSDPTYVTRDGEPVSPLLADANAAFVWLLRNQGQSVDYATTYGGYAFVTVTDGAPWADALAILPTLAVGQTLNLHVDTGELRVWLARTGVADGEPFARTVYVETLEDGRWSDVGHANGDAPAPTPWPADMADAYRATLNAIASAPVAVR